jgi:hypothetical protein
MRDWTRRASPEDRFANDIDHFYKKAMTEPSTMPAATGNMLTRPIGGVRWVETWVGTLRSSPHYRRPHMTLMWTGHGRAVPKIVPGRESIVHRESTGSTDCSEESGSTCLP